MSESDITVDLSLVDRLRPTFDRLVADLATVTPIERGLAIGMAPVLKTRPEAR